MRLASYTTENRESYGLVVDGPDGGDAPALVDASRRMGAEYPTLAAVLEAGALETLRALEQEAPDLSLDEVQLLPPVRGRNPVICVGRNYAEVSAQAGYEPAPYPSIFQRRHAAHAGHGANIVKPFESDRFDCEAELAVVIGTPGRRIPEDRALDYIAGYTILNEASLHDWMNHTSRNVTPGKNFDASGALGPWMVTADEIPDPTALTIVQRVNGEEVQSGPTSGMIYTIPRILAYLSTFTELIPGDVIATGTPGGIHARRQQEIFLNVGDTVEMEISGIGTLRNTVVEG